MINVSIINVSHMFLSHFFQIEAQYLFNDKETLNV